MRAVRLLVKSSIGGRAGFAHIAHLRYHCAFNRDVEIRVLEDHDWRITPELHRRLQNLVGSRLEQRPSDARGSSE